MPLLTLHAALLAWSGWRHSPILIESEHLAAGVSHLQLNRFDLFRVNPPLVRVVAALPVVLASPAVDWHRYDSNPLKRPDYSVGVDFVSCNGSRYLWLVTLARWGCIPFSLLGGYVCFRWSRDLNGTMAGNLALTLWCFSPFMLGHGSLSTNDVPTAALGVAAAYTFWKWLRRPSKTGTVVAGLILGLAELTKFTLIVFFMLWPVLWLAYRCARRDPTRRLSLLHEAVQLVGMLGLAVVVLNMGYLFEGSFQPLREFRFRSQALGGIMTQNDRQIFGGNRFAETRLGAVPVPVPRNYLQGIDRVKSEFEDRQRSYLAGEWKVGGWWYYHIYALIIKVPIGTWLVFGIATGVTVAQAKSRPDSGIYELVLLVPSLTIVIVVSSQTGFCHHARYMLPALPFLYVWCTKVVAASSHQIAAGRLVAFALCWSLISSLWIYPHSQSYFNELVGGPTRGDAHLLDSNLGWGQDTFFLRRWLDHHPEARPLHLAAFGHIDPRLVGIESVLPPVGPVSATNISGRPEGELGPFPGWYAIDVNFLHDSHWPIVGSPKHRDYGVTSDEFNLSYFLRFRPIARVGYSIFIYQISLDEANRVRRELMLPEWSEAAPPLETEYAFRWR